MSIDNGVEPPEGVAGRRLRRMKPGSNRMAIGIGVASFLSLGGLALFMTQGEDDAAQDGLIPRAVETPDERDVGGDLIGAMYVPRPAPAEPAAPPEDRRVTELEEEIAALRAALDRLTATTGPAAASDPGNPTGSEQPPSPAMSAAPDLERRLQGLQDALTSMVDVLDETREAQERRHREVSARLQAMNGGRPASSTATAGFSTATAAPIDMSAAEEEERRRKRAEERREEEAARLASPSVVLSGGSSADAAGPRGTTSSGNSFLDRAADRVVQTSYARRLDNPGALVPQGTIIPAILETAISSDLPGQLKARIKRDVWSADNATVLIPKGSTLIGEYSSDISLGQTRVLVAWNRIMTPDHRSVMIGSTGVDALGRAGQSGDVDHHFAFKFEAAFFISIFSAVGNIGNIFRDPVVSDAANTGGEAMQGAGESALEEYLSIPPTIYVDQGEDVNVFVSRDLYL